MQMLNESFLLGYGAGKAKGGGGGDVTLITKTITENGTYVASSDNADGYSSVTVNVQGSGGYVAADWLDMAKPAEAVVSDTATLSELALQGRKGVTGVELSNVTAIPASALKGCSAMTYFKAHKVTTLGSTAFYGCTALTAVAFPLFIGQNPSSVFYGCSAMTVADFGGEGTNGVLTTYCFRDCTNLGALVLRSTSMWGLANTNVFSGIQFPTTGKLYVPQSLVASYKTATNWSTLFADVDTQILPIEGSIYETQYADGTPITTT